MGISFSSECFRLRGSRNFTAEDADLITDNLLAEIIQSALGLQNYCLAQNHGVPCPAECQIAQLVLADLETLKSLFLNS